jgi:hypothetical protein
LQPSNLQTLVEKKIAAQQEPPFKFPLLEQTMRFATEPEWIP